MEEKDILKHQQNHGQIISTKRDLFMRMRVGMTMPMMVPRVLGGGKY
jgi:hypothetical protein